MARRAAATRPRGATASCKDKEEKYEQMKKAAYDADSAARSSLFGSEKTSEQHVPIIDALVNDHEGQFQVNVPNNGALHGLPDDVAVEVPAIVNTRASSRICVGALPQKIMLEQIYPDWLDMERTLEALLTGDKTMLLYGILQSHQTRSYEQAVETLEALMHMEPNEPMAVSRRHQRPLSVAGELGAVEG